LHSAIESQNAFFILLTLQKPLQWFRKKADEQGEREQQFFLNCFNKAKEAIDKGQDFLGAIICALKKQQRYDWTDRETAIILSSPYSAGVATVRSFSTRCIPSYANQTSVI